MAKLIIEGQTHTVDDAVLTSGTTVAEQDQNLRDALRPTFELVANATFQREQKDGELVVTVLKAPGPKGGYEQIVQCLRDAPGVLSPPMELACELQLLEVRNQLDRDTLLAQRNRIEATLGQGQHIRKRIEFARTVLLEAPAVASRTVPVGF